MFLSLFLILHLIELSLPTSCNIVVSFSSRQLERRLNESLSSSKWNKDRVTELEMKLTSLQEVCPVPCDF